MKKLIRNPYIQFLVVVVVVLGYSVAAGKSFEAGWSDLEQLLASSSPMPSPSVKPTALPSTSPSVFGTSTSSESAQVVSEVIDGDTIRLSSGETVRYIGIDTPEIHHPYVGKECFGEEASRRNEELVLGKTIILEKDVSETDRYDRLLRYVWLDGRMINEQLVQEGFANATPYPPDVKYQERLEVAESQAREQRVGLWSQCPKSE